MVLYGLTAPFAAALMDRFGIRRIAVTALGVVAGSAAHHRHGRRLAVHPLGLSSSAWAPEPCP